ncbi:TlpA family protein disulfide reductase [Flavihumibacter sp. R14]|nr:TlpA family protein disulfide reductase [Flavihumibacter soli]
MSFLAVIYLSVDAKTFLIRGLMRTGIYKADIKNERAKLLTSNSWTLPAGITLSDSNGRVINLSDQKGKLLFINFWATWCPPCRAEMPSINSLYSKVKSNKNIEFYMVDVDSKTKRSVAFMDQKKFELPVHSPASFIPPEIFDGNLPTTLVVSPDGKVVYHHTGVADYDHPEFLTFLNTLSK